MDWLSPIVSGTVGLGGLAVGWRVAAGSRRHEVAKWYRERRADAYVELLEVAEDISFIVARIELPWESDPPAVMPPMPTGERQGRARARVVAFGSPEVKAASDQWREAAATALREAEAVTVFGITEESGHDADLARAALEDARAQERKARAELDRAIHHDLSP